MLHAIDTAGRRLKGNRSTPQFNVTIADLVDGIDHAPTNAAQ